MRDLVIVLFILYVHSTGGLKNNGIIAYNDFINIVPVFLTINLKLVTLIFWMILSRVLVANNDPKKI